MGLFDMLFGPPPWAEQDDQTEIENAIAHNEARGDAAAIPESWHEAAEAGIQTFAEAEAGGWLADLDGWREAHGDGGDSEAGGGLFGWRKG